MDQFDAHALPIPHYLSNKDKDKLFSELAGFPENQNMFCGPLEDGLLQGDVCDGLEVINFHNGHRSTVRAIVLSNSCDIDLSNRGTENRKIMFCPVITLRRFADYLVEIGATQQQIDGTLFSLRKQLSTNNFFIPRKEGIIEDSIVMFDDIYSQPMQTVIERPPARRLSLNQYGYYIFLVKLSIHFLRVQEGVIRRGH